MLLTGAPFGSELGAHCAYWLVEVESMLIQERGGYDDEDMGVWGCGLYG